MKKLYILLMIIVVLSTTACSKYDADYYNLPKDNNIVLYEDFNDLLMFVSSGTNYIYFGKPECLWCQEYIVYYNNFAVKHDLDLLYFNADTVKSYVETTTDDGTLVIELSDGYQQVIDFLYSAKNPIENNFLSYNTIETSDGTLHFVEWLFVPRLVKVVDGIPVDVVGTVDGHVIVDGSLPALTDGQVESLMTSLDGLVD